MRRRPYTGPGTSPCYGPAWSQIQRWAGIGTSSLQGALAAKARDSVAPGWENSSAHPPIFGVGRVCAQDAGERAAASAQRWCGRTHDGAVNPDEFRPRGSPSLTLSRAPSVHSRPLSMRVSRGRPPGVTSVQFFPRVPHVVAAPRLNSLYQKAEVGQSQGGRAEVAEGRPPRQVQGQCHAQRSGQQAWPLRRTMIGMSFGKHLTTRCNVDNGYCFDLAILQRFETRCFC